MEETLTISLLKEAKDGSMASNEVHTFSRTEAIDIIAKALCADDVMREGYYQMAEAALNGLLEGK